jgi:hypothetical protein
MVGGETLERIIETTGVQGIREDTDDGQPELPDIIGQGEPGDDEPDYPGEYNAWMCYGGHACMYCMLNMSAGAVKAGDPFPTGDTAPPAHEGCQCELVAADPKTYKAPGRNNIYIFPGAQSEKDVQDQMPRGNRGEK